MRLIQWWTYRSTAASPRSNCRLAMTMSPYFLVSLSVSLLWIQLFYATINLNEWQPWIVLVCLNVISTSVLILFRVIVFIAAAAAAANQWQLSQKNLCTAEVMLDRCTPEMGNREKEKQFHIIFNHLSLFLFLFLVSLLLILCCNNESDSHFSDAFPLIQIKWEKHKS